MLFGTNSLLVPLGDDFRWGKEAEWEAQVSNYAQIMDYVNAHPDLQATFVWATLSDYFDSLRKETEAGRFSPKVLSGDFFT
jgi:hypothetical protein